MDYNRTFFNKQLKWQYNQFRGHLKMYKANNKEINRPKSIPQLYLERFLFRIKSQLRRY